MENLSSTPTTMVQFEDGYRQRQIRPVNDDASNIIGATHNDETLNDGSWWFSWRRLWKSKELKHKESSTKELRPERSRLAVDEQIIGTLGETYEICRPCTEMEMAHAYCSSDIGMYILFKFINP